MNRTIKDYLIALLLMLPIIAPAQQILQVVTKKIQKNFPYSVGYEVNVEGERAEMYVETWNKNEVRVEMDLIAKHPDIAIATTELERMKYVTDRVKNKIYIRNYIDENEGKPSSSMKARYVIYVPADCPVYLKDYFGTVNVSDLANKLRVKSEFTSIGLRNVKGEMDIKTRFGDLIGEQLDGVMRVEGRRSNITLRDLKGQYNIASQYGIIEIFANDRLIDLDIDAEKSDVFFYNDNAEIYSYQLTARHGRIQTPQDINFASLVDDANLQQLQFKPNREFYPSVTITVSFGDIQIRKAKE
ncbi:MAG: hypothetical protein AAGK47_02705 [Bacteroidota bacterium]